MVSKQIIIYKTKDNEDEIWITPSKSEKKGKSCKHDMAAFIAYVNDGYSIKPSCLQVVSAGSGQYLIEKNTLCITDKSGHYIPDYDKHIKNYAYNVFKKILK